MPRPDLTMTSSAVHELLGTCRTAAVAVPGPDGYPLAAMALVEVSAGELVLGLAQDDPVVDLLRAGVSTCLVADTWPSYDQIQGVIVRGLSVSGGAELEVHRVTSFDFSKAGG